MKKFLQKSCHWLVMLIAWFAVSATAWAVTIDCTGADPCGKTFGDVQVSGSGWNHHPSFGIYNQFGTCTITFESQKEIKKITFDCAAGQVADYSTTFFTTSDATVTCPSKNSAVFEVSGKNRVSISTSSMLNILNIVVELSDGTSGGGEGQGGENQGGGEGQGGENQGGGEGQGGENQGGSTGSVTFTTPMLSSTGVHEEGVVRVTLSNEWMTNHPMISGAISMAAGNTLVFETTDGSKITKIIVNNGYESADFSKNSFTANPAGTVTATSADYTWVGNESTVTLTTGISTTVVGSILVEYSSTSGGGTTEPTKPEFPLEATQYQVKLASNGLYLKVVENATKGTVLSAASQALTFTWDATHKGFTIQNADGLYVGGHSNNWNMSSSTPEYWTIEEYNGGYSFKCEKGYLGFDTPNVGEGAFRNKAQTKFVIEPYVYTPEYFTLSNNNWVVDGEKSSEYAYKQLNGFTISAPQDVSFASISSDAKVEKQGMYDPDINDYSYTEVEGATISIVEGKVRVVFATPYTNKGSYQFRIPAGSIVAEGGMLNKALTLAAQVDPTTYFNVTIAGAKEVSAPVSSLNITLPEGVTVSSVGKEFYYNLTNEVAVTSYSQEGSTLTINFADNALPKDTYFSLSLPEGFIVATDGSLNAARTSYSHFITGPRYVYDVVVVAPEAIADAEVWYYYTGAHAGDGGTISVTNEITETDITNGDLYGTDKEGYEYSIELIPAVLGGAHGKITLTYSKPSLHVESTSPSNGATVSLDNGTLSEVVLYLKESASYNYVTTIPEGFKLVDAEENEIVIDHLYIYGYEFKIVFNSINKAGTYTLTIPANSYEVEGKVVPETTVTFTVTGKTKFNFNTYAVSPRDNGSYTSIESLVLPIPEGVTFADGTETVTISVNYEDEDVEATFDATEKTITLAWEATEVGTYIVVIPEGTFTSEEGLKNYAVHLGYQIIPTLALNDAAADADGNYWTTFAFNNNYTLPEGYTPYKVVAVDDATGALCVEEIHGTPKTNDVDVYFNQGSNFSFSPVIDLSNNTFTVLDGKVSVTYDRGSSSIIDAFGGKYFDGTGTTFTITVLDPSVEITTASLLGWSCDYETSSNFEVVNNSYVVSVSGYGYVGGLRLGLATDEFNAPILPAGAGILVKASEASTGVAYTRTYNSATANMTGNLLVGCTESALWNEDGKTYYKFSLDADDAAGSAGFYWGVEGGASIQAHAGKAYLVLDTPAASNSRYLISGNGLTTGINAIATEATENIFNLQGQRVIAPKAGVYVKNGKKIIVK